MEEIWKDIKGYEGRYQVSNMGRVKSIMLKNTHILIPYIVNGRLAVTLYKKVSKKIIPQRKQVGRLVIETFNNIKLRNIDWVSYKDENKENCKLENLYIMTNGERQLKDSQEGHRKFDKCSFGETRKFEYYGELLTIREIAKKNKINRKLIDKRLKKYNWSIYEASEIPPAIFKNKKIKQLEEKVKYLEKIVNNTLNSINK